MVIVDVSFSVFIPVENEPTVLNGFRGGFLFGCHDCLFSYSFAYLVRSEFVPTCFVS